MLEFKSRRLPVMFLTLVLYCHCLITALPANIAVTVRLFNLLNTKSIKIEPIENDILVVKYNQSEWYELRGGSVLSADVGGDGIDVRLSNGKLTSCRNFAVHSPADKPFFISNDSIEKRLYSGNL